MENLTKSQQAEIMYRARLIHKKRVSVTNVDLAKDMNLASGRENLERLCLDLGLFPWGNQTDLSVMIKHINKSI